MKSLSIILPVHNGATFLEENVVHLLQWVPRFVHQFQMIIVDDGSLDGSADIAQNLAARFTQVEVVYHSCSHGEATAIKSGLARVKYDLTFIQATAEVEEKKIRAFLDNPAVLDNPSALGSPSGRQKPNTDDHLLARLMKWGMALKEHQGKTRLDIAATQESRCQEALPAKTRMTAPQYSSFPEKRLLEISRRDLETAKQPKNLTRTAF